MVNYLKLKFKPDFFQAAQHMTEAAQCYAAARMDSQAKASFIKAADLRLKDQDHSSAARCYELAGEFYKAADCYMICGSLDQAVRAIMKKSSSLSGEATEEELMGCYEKALDIYSKDDGKDVLASDIYKQYIPKLILKGKFEQHSAVSNRYIELLTRLNQWPFVHKEILSQVVVQVAKGETVGAERVLSGSNLNVPGFVQSPEFAAADQLIQAVRENDSELLKKVVHTVAVTYLNTEIVKLARSIKTITVEPGDAQASDNNHVDELLL